MSSPNTKENNFVYSTGLQVYKVRHPGSSERNYFRSLKFAFPDHSVSICPSFHPGEDTMKKSKPRILHRFAAACFGLEKLLPQQRPRKHNPLLLAVLLTLIVCVALALADGLGQSAPPAGATLPPPPSAASITGVVHVDDCNDPESALPTWICRDVPKNLITPGYPYYVGHDEPEMQFYSNKLGSGNNVQWKIKLPAADPTPDQAGTKIANRELFPTFWFSIALCDPESKPFGACTPNSDSNTSASGSAILELQFYPPGSSCPGDDSKWCASLTIDELSTNCDEPITAAPITTDGTPGGSSLADVPLRQHPHHHQGHRQRPRKRR